jgi:Predicted integral membrane protein (DUF2269)
MTLYALILFSHIAGAFFLFAGLALEWAAVSYLRKNPARVQADASLQFAGLAPRLYGPALGVILLSGGYLGSKIDGFSQGWVLVSLVTLLLIGTIGVAFTAPRFRALLKTFVEKSRDMSYQGRRHDPILLASVRFRIALVLGVVLLMVSKLNLRLSLVTMACAAALGILVALPAWRRSRVLRVEVSN